MLGYYRPTLSPPKNPIKREKKKLAYSSEREDFIQSGEDWFVRILRVLENCINPCQLTYSASSQTASPPLGRALKKSPFLRTKTEKCYDL